MNKRMFINMICESEIRLLNPYRDERGKLKFDPFRCGAAIHLKNGNKISAQVLVLFDHENMVEEMTNAKYDLTMGNTCDLDDVLEVTPEEDHLVIWKYRKNECAIEYYIPYEMVAYVQFGE